MKIKYEFADETKEIEIDESTATLIKDLDRQEYNNNKKETRRHCSIEKGLEFGIIADTSVDVEQEYIQGEELKQLHKALKTLTAEQRKLVCKVFYDKQPLKEIAAEYGTTYQAIQNRLNKILERLRKNF